MASPSTEQHAAKLGRIDRATERREGFASLNRSRPTTPFRAILLAITVGALGAAGVANAAPVFDVTFGQAGGNSEVYFKARNADAGVTYDSAELKYDELLTAVAQAVKDNNPNYATNSLAEIMGGWAYGVSPGEVSDGWTASLTDGVLDFSHGQFGVDTWLNTTDNPNQDELSFSVNFFTQLDFNHNGQYDANLEQLAQSDSSVADAFIGSAGDGLNFFKTDTNAIQVIPEPGVLSLMGVVGAGLMAARRFWSVTA